MSRGTIGWLVVVVALFIASPFTFGGVVSYLAAFLLICIVGFFVATALFPPPPEEAEDALPREEGHDTQRRALEIARLRRRQAQLRSDFDDAIVNDERLAIGRIKCDLQETDNQLTRLLEQ